MVRFRRRNILVGLGTIVFGTSGFIASGAFQFGSQGSTGDNWVQVASAEQTAEAEDTDPQEVAGTAVGTDDETDATATETETTETESLEDDPGGTGTDDDADEGSTETAPEGTDTDETEAEETETEDTETGPTETATRTEATDTETGTETTDDESETTDSLVQVVADPGDEGNHVGAGGIDWESDASISASDHVAATEDGLLDAFSVENANREAVSRVGLVDESGHPEDRVAFLIANVGDAENPGEGGVQVDISMDLQETDVNGVDPADVLNFPYRTVTGDGDTPADRRGTDLLGTTTTLSVSDLLEVVIEIDSRSSDQSADLREIVAAVEAVEELAFTATGSNE